MAVSTWIGISNRYNPISVSRAAQEKNFRTDDITEVKFSGFQGNVGQIGDKVGATRICWGYEEKGERPCILLWGMQLAYPIEVY